MDFQALGLYRVRVEMTAEKDVLVVANSRKEAERTALKEESLDTTGFFEDFGDITAWAIEVKPSETLTDKENELCKHGNVLIQDGLGEISKEQYEAWGEEVKKEEIKRKREEFLVRHNGHFSFWYDCVDNSKKTSPVRLPVWFQAIAYAFDFQ